MPYATIIIPTHSRAETLPLSVGSALSQTVGDIEVVIVGDGCTHDVRNAALALQSQDGRVRFHDRPKGEGHGAASRDEAIRTATSERIFYNDDDDLLLPHHVEVLGAALDEVDIVDTPAVSLHGGGGISFGVHDIAWPVLREMLVDQTFKSVFDTHLAHRRSSYLRGEGAWLGASPGGVAAHFLQNLAADRGNRWRTICRATALSLHGAHRIMMNGKERADELERVWREFRCDGENRVKDRAGCAFHGRRLFGALKSRGTNTNTELLAKARQLPLTERQLGTIEAARHLVDATHPEELDAMTALDELLDASLGAEWPTERVTLNYVTLFGPDAVDAMLDGCRPRLAVDVARLHVDLSSKRPTACPSDILEKTPSWQRFFSGVSMLSGLARAKDHRAWQLQEELLALAPQSIQALGYWNLRTQLAQDAGELEIARHAKATARQIESLIH